MSKVTDTDRDRMRKDAIRRLYALPERRKDKSKASKRRKGQKLGRRTSTTTNHAR